MKKKLYIVTPINARREPTFRTKYMAARHRVNMLKEIIGDDERFADYEPTSTFDLPHSENEDEATAMSKCVNAVMTCDAIYLDRGWNNSKGCRLEYHTAKIYEKGIFYHEKM